jgi:hypothetical protein
MLGVFSKTIENDIGAASAIDLFEAKKYRVTTVGS